VATTLDILAGAGRGGAVSVRARRHQLTVCWNGPTSGWRPQPPSREYLQVEGSFTDRLPWLVLTGRLLDEHVLAVRRWAEWATGVVETWPDDITRTEPPLNALRAMADRIDAARSTAQRPSAHEPQDAEGP
jgi:hypothetical protein